MNNFQTFLYLARFGFEVTQSGKRPGNVFAYLQNEAQISITIELFERSPTIEYDEPVKEVEH
jgi:hypothetical protein